MMKPRSSLIQWKRFDFDPASGVAEQLVQLDSDYGPVASDIFIRRSEFARLLPGFVEHPAVQIAAKNLRTAPQEPSHAGAIWWPAGCFPAPSRSVRLHFDVPWNEARLLIQVQRGLPVLSFVTIRPVEN